MKREQAQRLLHGSAQAFTILFTQRDLQVAIRDSLKVIGESATVDRSYIFRCFRNEAGEWRGSQRFEWSADSVTPQIDNPELQDMTLDYFQPYLDTLIGGKSFYGLVRSFPATLQEVLLSQGIMSIIICPIMVNGALQGFVGFDVCNEERIWNEDELTILMSYAASLGSAIERLEVEARLLEAKDAAEAANRAKTTFIANVSHEIRTPLNAILGFSELISDQELDAQTRRYVTAIKTAGDSLLSLINTILDLSKMDAYKLSLFPEAMSIRKILTEFDTIFGLKARGKGLVFETAALGVIPDAVFLDPSRIRQIFFNLVGNSIKFTEHGFVRLEAGAEPAGEDRVTLRLAVRDSGIGISKESMETLFRAFTQMDAEGTRKYGGTGLGLTITKRLVSLMGGSIAVESEPGKGSTFTVVLPDVPVVTLPSQGQDEKPHTLRFKPATLLLVEDNRPNRLVVQGYLKDSGITVVEAENGEQGVEMAIALAPDLILMDMQMPVMGGRAAFEQLRRLPLTEGIPIIAATANSLDLDDGTLSVKFDGYLEKPFTKAQLHAQISRFLPIEESCRNCEDLSAGSGRASQAAGPATASGEGRRFARAEALAAEFMEEWRGVGELKSIDDIAGFGAGVLERARVLEDRNAIAWADELILACRNFDLPVMERLFDGFPLLAGAETKSSP